MSDSEIPVHIGNIPTADKREKHCEYNSGHKHRSAAVSHPAGLWIIATEDEFQSIGKTVANVCTNRRQHEQGKDVMVIGFVWLANIVQIVHKCVAQDCRWQEQQIVDDAATLPVSDGCLSEETEIAHEIL
jgi:hypothetical protein